MKYFGISLARGSQDQADQHQFGIFRRTEKQQRPDTTGDDRGYRRYDPPMCCRSIVLAVLTLGLLAACTTTDVQQASRQTTPTGSEIQQQQFQQGKAFFQQRQYQQAARLLLPLAQQGHLEAQYAIGYMYHYGYGVPRNERESTRWISIAATRGHPKAIEALQMINSGSARP